MTKVFQPQVSVTADATGAYQAGKSGNLVIIVDVIDMSTTLESALEAGATAVFGASPASVRPPVPVDPGKIGLEAGSLAVKFHSPLIVVCEPRWGKRSDFIASAAEVLEGIHLAGAEIADIIPNLGASTVKICDFKQKVVVAITDTGGVAFDAAYNAGGTVIVGTIARTFHSKGTKPAQNAVARALAMAQQLKKDISVVAASANSLEDVLAAQYIGQRLWEAIRNKY
ncbi:hypothetical protein [Zhaonella formicivorans]|uniref:hypothetical protein n=1 Tax=Zhaonella formicivorans TaxID=2528593 RepID=UPI0010E57F4B|nr:hypothetical protein [Zhaonella formicivorans]